MTNSNWVPRIQPRIKGRWWLTVLSLASHLAILIFTAFLSFCPYSSIETLILRNIFNILCLACHGSGSPCLIQLLEPLPPTMDEVPTIWEVWEGFSFGIKPELCKLCSQISPQRELIHHNFNGLLRSARDHCPCCMLIKDEAGEDDWEFRILKHQDRGSKIYLDPINSGIVYRISHVGESRTIDRALPFQFFRKGGTCS